ncbi:hypothetical protein B0H16DRAFT_1468965 [Mycena metata]|uniref:Uncharacterized protein n=1 Tax=Mycena metata TaxID=1033252 RepID=A0AAD7MTT3_9AGAR|nr:hypothetical protein B0H16DRAFT_1468965 [Mycena metata]
MDEMPRRMVDNICGDLSIAQVPLQSSQANIGIAKLRLNIACGTSQKPRGTGASITQPLMPCHRASMPRQIAAGAAFPPSPMASRWSEAWQWAVHGQDRAGLLLWREPGRLMDGAFPNGGASRQIRGGHGGASRKSGVDTAERGDKDAAEWKEAASVFAEEDADPAERSCQVGADWAKRGSGGGVNRAERSRTWRAGWVQRPEHGGGTGPWAIVVMRDWVAWNAKARLTLRAMGGRIRRSKVAELGGPSGATRWDESVAVVVREGVVSGRRGGKSRTTQGSDPAERGGWADLAERGGWAGPAERHGRGETSRWRWSRVTQRSPMTFWNRKMDCKHVFLFTHILGTHPKVFGSEGCCMFTDLLNTENRPNSTRFSFVLRCQTKIDLKRETCLQPMFQSQKCMGHRNVRRGSGQDRQAAEDAEYRGAADPDPAEGLKTVDRWKD